MALNIRNAEAERFAERFAEELAKQTGETKTETATKALRDRLLGSADSDRNGRLPMKLEEMLLNARISRSLIADPLMK